MSFLLGVLVGVSLGVVFKDRIVEGFRRFIERF